MQTIFSEMVKNLIFLASALIAIGALRHSGKPEVAFWQSGFTTVLVMSAIITALAICLSTLSKKEHELLDRITDSLFTWYVVLFGVPILFPQLVEYVQMPLMLFSPVVVAAAAWAVLYFVWDAAQKLLSK